MYMIKAMILNHKYWPYLLIIMAFAPINSSSQNIGIQDLQKFQSLVDNNGQSQPQPLEQPGLSQDKNEMSEQEMMAQENEEDDEPVRQKPINLDSRPEPKLLNSELKPFGYDLFSKSPTTFAPATDIPVSPSYIIGPGDNIEVILFGKQNQELTLQVTREGEVYFPSIGPISVAGLTFDEMKKVLLQRINNQIIGVEASITLGVLKSIQVFVLGEAYQPGGYTISALSTLTNALFASGGVKDNGSLRKIKLNRKGETIVEFDLYDLLLSGDTSKDQRLQSGDVIFIPTIERSVGIDGEIRRPGIYELIDTETVKDLIKFSGGLTPLAHRSSAQIERIHSRDGITLLDLDLNDDQSFNRTLFDGDVLYAYPISNIMQDVVLISGYFNRPGFYQWKRDLRISDLVDRPDDLLPNIDINYLVIKRENPSNKTYSAFQADLSALINGKTEENLKLMPRDEIFFFSRMKTETEQENLESKRFLREKIIELEEEKLELELNEFDRSQISNNQSSDLNPLQAEEAAKMTLIEDLIDDDLETLVMKDNVVKIIRKEELDLYENQGFIKVESDEEMLKQSEINASVLLGDRNVILDKFINTLKLQGQPGKPSPLVSIEGGVLFPGQYPFTPNMTVQDAIYAGGGLEDTTYIDDIEITRVTLKDKEYISSRSNIDASQLSNVKLMAGDRLLIKSVSKKEEYVNIEGEVYFPGKYYLEENETLLSLINRAGGLKEQAFLPASFFQRESLKERQLKRLQEAQDALQQQILFQATRSQIGDDREADPFAILNLLETDISDEDEEGAGRLILDLEGIIAGKRDDLTLENKDRIVIRKKPQAISVIGEVFVPSSHIYSENSSMDDYLRLSGGFKASADTDSIYVIKVDGSISTNISSGFFRSDTQGLQAGDTIVVPLQTSTFSNVRAAQDVTRVIYELAVAAAAISSF